METPLMLQIRPLLDHKFKVSAYKREQIIKFLTLIYDTTIWYFVPQAIGGEYRGYDMENKHSYYLSVAFLKDNRIPLPPDNKILSLELYDLLKRNFK
jgi:hypothetical protein